MTRLYLFLIMTCPVLFIEKTGSGFFDAEHAKDEIDNGTSITFILGKDDLKLNNSYYKSATEYFTYDENAKTDELITQFTTITEVVEYLSDEKFKNIFKTINIISHGNPWQGLSAKIYKDGPRCNSKNIESSLDSEMIKQVCSNGIDDSTNINIISCGVGLDEKLCRLLTLIFSCSETNVYPNVTISKDYVFFDTENELRKADYYFIVSKYKYPDIKTIERKIKYKYPNASINWEDALSRTKLEDNKPFYHNFRIVVDWKFISDDLENPVCLKNENDIKKYLKSQKMAYEQLETMNLNIDDIQWFSFYNDNVLKIKGYANIEGVLMTKS